MAEISPFTQNGAVLQPLKNGPVTPSKIETGIIDESMRAAAQDFEAAFLTQMLTFSGLGDALTLGGGEASSAFAGFYIESLAEKMTEAGGLGLADRFYVELQQLSNSKTKEGEYDDLGKL